MYIYKLALKEFGGTLEKTNYIAFHLKPVKIKIFYIVLLELFRPAVVYEVQHVRGFVFRQLSCKASILHL